MADPLTAASDLPDPHVIAVATTYPDDTLLDWHDHTRAQLLYASPGVMRVDTAHGSWTVPPQHAVWIPTGQPHRVLMRGATTRSLYIDASAPPRAGRKCEVLVVSGLLRELLIATAEIPVVLGPRARDGAVITLLLHEIAAAATLPVNVPFPKSPGLMALCRAFLDAPDAHASPETWAGSLAMSVSTFGRRFRMETGMTFARWRQHASVAAALSRLASGAPVTTIALEQGYESPAAFTTMFKRVLGKPPSAFGPTDADRLPSDAQGSRP